MSIDVSSIPFPASGIFWFLLFFVMPGLEPGIHVFSFPHEGKTWMAGTSPAMTNANYFPIRDATSAIAFITALRTPGSYSVCPAASTVTTSASVQRAASACAVDGGHSRS